MNSDYDDAYTSSSGEDDFDYSDESEKPSVQPSGYTIVHAADIISEMNKYIDKVNDIFKIEQHLIRRLLVHFKWNPEQLIDRYYESGDGCAELFREAGIAPSLSYSTASTCSRREKSSRGTCSVCYTDNTERIGLLCGHYFCSRCWVSYIQLNIRGTGNVEYMQCMENGCSVFLSESFIVDNIKHEDVKNKFYQLLAASYVTANRMYKWCPTPGCGNCARVSSLDVKHITCTCGMQWCFGCGEADHAPLESCILLKKWKKKAMDESETNKWLVVNTKECPKCAAAIEKNGGCNHMTCSNMACSFEFCWICLGDWAPHGSDWFSCNKFVEDEEQTALVSKERKAMERYHHYYDRFWTHKRSGDFEETAVIHIKNKVDYIQQHLQVTWIESQFLIEALKTLTKCRRMLQYSYILAFYLTRSPQTLIFEENQKDLEHNTEQLSGLLEDHRNPEDMAGLLELKMKVNNRAAYCETRRNVLLKDVKTGYETGIWKYRNL